MSEFPNLQKGDVPYATLGKKEAYSSINKIGVLYFSAAKENGK